MSRIDNTKEFVPVRIAVLTVSDSRTLTEDKSGQTLVDRIEGAGHIVAQREIIRDERVEIAEQLRKWVAMDAIDVIISTGGTGLTGRDVTVEAHRDVYEKEVDAFGTVFTIKYVPHAVAIKSGYPITTRAVPKRLMFPVL